MAIPSINDLVRYINRKLRGNDWNNNFQKIINWLTDGTSDLSINSMSINSNLEIDGNLDVVGDITADKFIGDGSDLSGLNEWRKNFLINGGCLIKSDIDYTLVKDVYGVSVDRFYGMATGTTVDAGVLTQTSSANCGNTGYAIKFEECSITGSGELYLRHRLYSKNAVNFKNVIGSFSFMTYHNTSSSVIYTIYINKADSLNDFSSITEITNNGGVGVSTDTATQIKYENISFGDCSNGLEILIKVECGEITLKSFEFAELQLELGNNTTEFEYRNVETDLAMNNYDDITGELKEIIDTAQIKDEAVSTNKIKYNAIELYNCRSVPILCQTLGLNPINKINKIVATITVGTNPLGIAFDGENIWVSNASSNTVSKIDRTTNTVIATINVGITPKALTYGDGYIWVVNDTGNSISKIDIITDTVVATISSIPRATKIMFDGDYIWAISRDTDALYKIDITTNSLIATIHIDAPGAICFDGEYVWVASATGAGNINKIDRTTNNVVYATHLLYNVLEIFFDGYYIWGCNESASIRKIDLSTYHLCPSLNSATAMASLAYDGRYLWAGTLGSNYVIKIDTYTLEVLKEISVGGFPRAMCFDGENIWIANYDSHNVTKISVYRSIQ